MTDRNIRVTEKEYALIMTSLLQTMRLSNTVVNNQNSSAAKIEHHANIALDCRNLRVKLAEGMFAR